MGYHKMLVKMNRFGLVAMVLYRWMGCGVRLTQFTRPAHHTPGHRVVESIRPIAV